MKLTSRFTLLLAGILLSGSAFVFAQVPEWRPVTQAELDLKTPKVEADADAEAIFWEVRLDDKKLNKLSYDHYVRVKIFTVRGRERFSKMDIPFMKGKTVEDVAARVIKPDGTIIELKPSDIFEREIARAGKAKFLAKSFAVPGIEPGVIVEYQYKETYKNDTAEGERLIFQRDIPMQRVSYYIRPAKSWTLKTSYFNMPAIGFKPDRDGFSVATMTDVPAFKEEPYMPPDDEVRRWIYLSYQRFGSAFDWSMLNYNISTAVSKIAKPSSSIKQKAAELTANVATTEEKLKRIYNFVQKQIRNISYDRSLTAEQREDIKIKDVDDVLEKRMGSSMFIDLLFASLARAAGFEANVVLLADRREIYFTPERYPFPRFVEPGAIAVHIGEEWWYFNPGSPFLPSGQIVWYEEGMPAMIVREQGFGWSRLPLAAPANSKAKRTAKFTLSDDGTLAGRVNVAYTGHQANSRRRDAYFDSSSKREEDIKESIKSRISTAEISDISIENFDDNESPLIYSYNVKIPGYAQRTGKRMFLQPGFFRFGIGPIFSSETRTNSIYFQYPWSEDDHIEIKLPDTMVGESIFSPPPLSANNNVGSLQITLTTMKESNTLIYDRTFHFGGGGNILFAKQFYFPLKTLFDGFHKLDTHTITLRQR